MSDEIKPCPFCGCTDISMYTNGSDLDNYSYVVECDGCGCILDTGFDSEERAIEEWNHRILPTTKVYVHKYYIGTNLNIVGTPSVMLEYLCGNCKKKVISGDDYCSHCGARLGWK